MSYPKIDMSRCILVSQEAASPWDGKKRPLYRVPLDMLHYNVDNGRIATWISGYRSDPNSTPLEKMSVEELNKTIGVFIKNSASKATYDKTYRDISAKGQLVMGAILDDGTIVSGNRRFTVLRELLKDTGNHDSFGYFLCNIFQVPSSIEEKKEIKRLETTTQFNEDHPVDYGPIDKLVDIYTNVLAPDAPYSVENYRVFLNLQPGKMNELLARARVLIEYLEYINKPNNYDIARTQKLDGPIKELASLSKTIGESRWNEVKAVFFKDLMLTTNGDRTREIRKVIRAYQSNPDGFAHLQEMNDDEDVAADQQSFGIEASAQSKKPSDDNGAFQNEVSRFVTSASTNAARRKPIEKVNDAYNDLVNVDLDSAALLSQTEKDEIENCCKKIETKLFDIRKKIS